MERESNFKQGVHDGPIREAICPPQPLRSVGPASAPAVSEYHRRAGISNVAGATARLDSPIQDNRNPQSRRRSGQEACAPSATSFRAAKPHETEIAWGAGLLPASPAFRFNYLRLP